MTASRDFLDYVLELLAPLGPISTRKMFGSVGLYLDGKMFAVVSGDNRFYLKADAQNRPQFESAGCLPFTYTAAKASGGRKTIALSYFSPPESILDDRHAMLAWAQLGVEAATRAPEKKGTPFRS